MIFKNIIGKGNCSKKDQNAMHLTNFQGKKLYKEGSLKHLKNMYGQAFFIYLFLFYFLSFTEKSNNLLNKKFENGISKEKKPLHT